MNEFVLDASALIAMLRREPGIENLPPPSEMMRLGVISAVNLAEAHSKLVQAGVPESEAWELALTPIGEVAAFSAAHARRAGALIPQTRRLGLSLGDRACLALALEQGLPVYTTDRVWSQLNLGIPIHVIR